MPVRTRTNLDTGQNAKQVFYEAVARAAGPARPTRSMISRVMAQMGAKGGKIGGRRRLEAMSAAQRRAVAKRAAARSAKKRPEK